MFPFVARRSISYIFSGVLLALSLVAWLVLPTRFGIDMTGGTVADYTWNGELSEAQISQIKTEIAELSDTITLSGSEVINDTLVYRVAGVNTLVVEAGFLTNASDVAVTAAKEQFRAGVKTLLAKTPSATFVESKYQNVGAAFGEYIKAVAIKTLVLVVIAISLYIAYAFRGSIAGLPSWSFAASTALSLAHDVFVAFGLYLVASYFFPEFKVDTFFVTAMLTILGYSVNDTIVVLDRIRSDLKIDKKSAQDLKGTINRAINETLTRSIRTSLTIVFVLLAMFFFGPEAIRGFTLALIFGTIVGTYSSICIAAPLIYDFSKQK